MRAAHVVRLDFQVREGVGARAGAQQEVAVGLVRVGALRLGVHADQPAEDRAPRVLQRPLEEEVAGGVRRDVVLQRLVVEVLRPLRDVHAQHVHVRARRLELALHVRARQVAAERGVERGDLCVAPGHQPVRAQVRDPSPEALHRHVRHLCALLRHDLRRAHRERGRRHGVGGELVHDGDLRAGLGHHQQPPEGRRPGAAEPAVEAHGRLHPHVLGHVQEEAAAPEGVAHGGELPVLGRHRAAQVALHQLGVLGRGAFQRGQDHPLRRELRRQVAQHHGGVHLHRARALARLGHQGAQRGGAGVGGGGRGLIGEGERVQPQHPPDVGVAPLLGFGGGHGGLGEDAVGPLPRQAQPLRLHLARGKDLHLVAREDAEGFGGH